MKNFCANKGFSLVELLVIVAIIGIMAVVSLPMLMKQLPRWHMNGAARDINAKLMMARLRAIQENEQFGVSFDLGGAIDRYTVVKFDSDTASWRSVGVVADGTVDIEIDLAGCVGSRIEFNADGSASTEGGCVNGANLNVVTVRAIATGQTRNIFLSTFTGNLSMD